MLILLFYFFGIFFCIFASEFYADKDKIKVDKIKFIIHF